MLPNISKKIKKIYRSKDSRGSIISIVEEKMNNISIIKCTAQSIRSNHFHIKNWHFMYVLQGVMEYFFENKNKIFFIKLKNGDLVFTPPKELHATYFPAKTLLLVASKNKRDQKTYEKDTVRKKFIDFKNIKSIKVKTIYNFGLMPIGNDLQKNILKSLKCKKYPLKLINCLKCNHFQLSISINPKLLYAKNYTYLTGVTKTFKEHFENYSKWIIKKCKLKNNSLILDIGSNDGTCLSFFKKKNIKVLGIDPAKKPSFIANKNKIPTLNQFFNKKTAVQIENKYGKFDFITSHNVLAHTENIQEIFLSIYNLLRN